jgi:nicotinate-nucleotide pyrophosphorylase (carboxylating)
MFPNFILKRKIAEFLEEDLSLGDVSIEGIPKVFAEAELICKEEGVIAGIEVVKLACDMLNIDVLSSIKDGSNVSAGDVVMEIRGEARNILMAERTILNILMKMSGIATTTAEIVKKAKRVNPKVVIAGTRKTTPGFRIFEKIAISIGGGDPHRFGLGDCVLIKNNHIAILGDLIKAIRVAKASFTKKIEVEVGSFEEAIKAAKEGVDIIMLDNMKPEEIKRTVKELENKGLRNNLILEVSGGINPENVKEYALTGVDVLSSGYITHSSRALDLSLKIKR